MLNVHGVNLLTALLAAIILTCDGRHDTGRNVGSEQCAIYWSNETLTASKVTSCIDNSSVCIYFNASRLKEGSIYADSTNIFIPIDKTKVCSDNSELTLIPMGSDDQLMEEYKTTFTLPAHQTHLTQPANTLLTALMASGTTNTFGFVLKAPSGCQVPFKMASDAPSESILRQRSDCTRRSECCLQSHMINITTLSLYVEGEIYQVIFPTILDIKRCVGGCSSGFVRTYSENLYQRVRSLNDPQYNPCCVATKFRNQILILGRRGSGVTIQRSMPVIAEHCSCM